VSGWAAEVVSCPPCWRAPFTILLGKVVVTIAGGVTVDTKTSEVDGTVLRQLAHTRGVMSPCNAAPSPGLRGILSVRYVQLNESACPARDNWTYPGFM
jgi:hypothetical protein